MLDAQICIQGRVSRGGGGRDMMGPPGEAGSGTSLQAGIQIGPTDMSIVGSHQAATFILFLFFCGASREGKQL